MHLKILFFFRTLYNDYKTLFKNPLTHQKMTEEFLQFVWEQKLFNTGNLKTVTGKTLEIIEAGTLNTDSGPDFFNARIKMDNTIWAGNIEIHKMASDWYRHQHQEDEAYDTVILHVVHRYDQQILRSDGEEIPTLVLPVPDHVLANYQQLINSAAWIPCQEKIHLMDEFVLKIGFNRLMIERLQERTSEITERLKQNNHDWNETFYQLLARSFGFKTNAVPFELLAKSTPPGILGKHRDNLLQLEALLFGQSGLLHQELLGDNHYLKLRAEYEFLAGKYHLKPIAGYLWKFLRIRPVNFPTIRIAQFAALFYKNDRIFSILNENISLSQLKELFNVTASPYWNNHYRFNQVSGNGPKHLGETAADGLIINCVIPFIFVYGEQTEKYFLKDKALEWLDQLPSEENLIVSGWNNLGIFASTAFESQALLQLKNRYCDRKRCLHCHIGSKLIRSC